MSVYGFYLVSGKELLTSKTIEVKGATWSLCCGLDHNDGKKQHTENKIIFIKYSLLFI